MMANQNKSIFSGRLTAAPELRKTETDISVTSFTVACNRPKQKGKTEEIADFIDVVAWRSTAEFICKYFQKGSAITVVGRLQTRTWTDKEGKKRKTTEVLIEETYFGEPKKAGTSHEEAPPEFEEITDDGELPL